ncbi:glycosyltransferase family 4 protein [archaeon]|jgi:glycosyltransferase involved in cell wall biosynthesis|nr:glycosyltransferase family 4 protein [archaeon]MBT6735412.1 glycosyltransferase family 4 protein [Candidatus Woesearchaeota archaeon]MBT7107335.1 glycosyltransferase family 4 protein [archaeon]MBT7297301.1 glycosyltransferase family 4 protein [archaeon]
MRILVLNYEFPPLGGGASPVSYEISKGYVKLGHKVDVVTMGYKDLPHFEVKEGINIHRVKCLRSKKEICHPWEQLTYIISAKKFLKKHLKDNRYDICHCHFIIPTGIVALWVKKKFKIPYIITAHGSDVPNYNPDRFKILHKFTGPILNNICKESKFLTTPSGYLANLIKKEIGRYNIITIPNGSEDYLNRSIKKENIILSSGRLLKRKGYQYLIQGFNELDPKNWKLYIVGDGPYKKELLKIANKNKNIIFTGWINNKGQKFSNLLNKSKIFSLLSERESQGIVFIEGMSCGCAILSSDITACKETVSKDVGFLVKRENIEEIKNKLKILLENEKLLTKFMKNSRKRYKLNFRYEKIVKKYLNEIK